MRRPTRMLLAAALIVTAGTLTTWLATGRHFYTKFEVVERVTSQIDPDDPLAGTGFYDSETVETTVLRDEFHLGLLPTPRGLFDKHMISGASILGGTWGPLLLGLWFSNKRRKKEGENR